MSSSDDRSYDESEGEESEGEYDSESQDESAVISPDAKLDQPHKPHRNIQSDPKYEKSASNRKARPRNENIDEESQEYPPVDDGNINKSIKYQDNFL